MMTAKTKNNWSTTINTQEDLQREQRRLKARIRVQEKELRARVQKLPGELFSAGVSSVIPPILSGKITSSALSIGKNLINNAFTRHKDGERNNSKLLTAAKQMGIFALLRVAFTAFMRKK